MNHPTQPDITPALMLCPAFCVKDGIITEVNSAAVSFGIQAGTQINELISVGAEEFSCFTQGRMDMTLTVDNTPISACVIPNKDSFVFCLDSAFTRPEQRALALAAQHLREPISNIMSCTVDIQRNLPTDDQHSFSVLQKNLQQITRMLYNMSDLATYRNCANLAYVNIVAVFQEIMEKSQTLLEKTKKKLIYSLPEQPIFCNADDHMLRRAALNLLSNAAIFIENSDIIEASLTSNNDRLYFSVENSCNKNFDLSRDLFSRYMRDPGIEDGRNGIGLGLPIVNAVASAHNGVVLMTQPEAGRIRITMTISTCNTAPTGLRSPIRIPIDRNGGWDQSLLELSGVLPPELYNQ